MSEIKPSPLRRFQGGWQRVTLGCLFYCGRLQAFFGTAHDKQQANNCKRREG